MLTLDEILVLDVCGVPFEEVVVSTRDRGNYSEYPFSVFWERVFFYLVRSSKLNCVNKIK